MFCQKTDAPTENREKKNMELATISKLLHIAVCVYMTKYVVEIMFFLHGFNFFSAYRIYLGPEKYLKSHSPL